MAHGSQRARLPIPPTATLLSCLWSRRIFLSLPAFLLMIFYRDASSALLQLVTQWLNFTNHVLTLSATEARIQILFFTRIELTTSALGVRGYLLDHSRNEGQHLRIMPINDDLIYEQKLCTETNSLQVKVAGYQSSILFQFQVTNTTHNLSTKHYYIVPTGNKKQNFTLHNTLVNPIMYVNSDLSRLTDHCNTISRLPIYDKQLPRSILFTQGPLA